MGSDAIGEVRTNVQLCIGSVDSRVRIQEGDRIELASEGARGGRSASRYVYHQPVLPNPLDLATRLVVLQQSRSL